VIDSHRYPAEVFFSDEDEGYIALARDLPGCSAFGETQEEALRELQQAIAAWQLAAQSAGNPVPEPSRPAADHPLPSGKILLRTPRSLHAALIEAAKRDAVSLNQYLVSVLSASTAADLVLSLFARRISQMTANAVPFWWPADENITFVYHTGRSSTDRLKVWQPPDSVHPAQPQPLHEPKFLTALAEA
jgi:predicted RNase H-like HicB family nuclease